VVRGSCAFSDASTEVPSPSRLIDAASCGREVDSVYELADARAAFERGKCGKFVLRVV
jgi:hypothetical protein